MKEIEIQVQVEHLKPLEKFLNSEAKFLKEEHQLDEYFTPIEHSFTEKEPVSDWLRLRSENSKNILTFKHWHFGTDGKSHHCDEYETKVSDPAEMKRLLLALNFKPLITVNKHRRSYRYQKYEISLDSVEGLGDFVEVEYKTDEDVDTAEITAKMMEFLKERKVGSIERNFKGYPKLLLEKL